MWGDALKIVLKVMDWFTGAQKRRDAVRKKRDAALAEAKKKAEEGVDEEDAGKITSGFDDINNA